MSNTETPARRGRKPSFPDQETVPVLTHIPEDARSMLREIAKARNGGLINVTIDALIRQAYARSQAARKASRAKAQASS